MTAAIAEVAKNSCGHLPEACSNPPTTCGVSGCKGWVSASTGSYGTKCSKHCRAKGFDDCAKGGTAGCRWEPGYSPSSPGGSYPIEVCECIGTPRRPSSCTPNPAILGGTLVAVARAFRLRPCSTMWTTDFHSQSLSRISPASHCLKLGTL